MQVKNIVERDDGTNELVLTVSQEETEYLINVALDYLAFKDMIKYEKVSEDTVNLEILKNLSEEDFHQA